jgi:hypothetical protein
VLYDASSDCYSVFLGPIFLEGGVEMEVNEPRVRRRGFFLHSDTTGEPETGELENPEGFTVRVRISRPAVPRQVASATGRSRTTSRAEDTRPEIRSGSVTGSRQRAHLPR